MCAKNILFAIVIHIVLQFTDGCDTSNDCVPPMDCLGGQCVMDPCKTTHCGVNAECKVVNLYVMCACLPGYKRAMNGECSPSGGCLSDIECAPPLSCIGGQCIADPCKETDCGTHAECTVVNQEALCRCLPGYLDPDKSTYPYKCVPGGACGSDKDCSPSLGCVQGRCVDPCLGVVCRANETCAIVDHKSFCQCVPGYEESGNGQCLMIDYSCISNKDCAPPLNCIGGHCMMDLCKTTQCAMNEECQVVDNAPACFCLPGYKRAKGFLCAPGGACSTNKDCSPSLGCIQGRCVDPCRGLDCGANANCDIVDQEAVCGCLPGFEKTQSGVCLPIREGDCSHDCTPPHLCVGGQCILDPCQSTDCGVNTECRVLGEDTVCRCLPGNHRFLDGQCTPGGPCSSDKGCSPSLGCIEGQCVDPCVGISCREKAACVTVDQKGLCTCLPGYLMTSWGLCSPIASSPPIAKCETFEDCPPPLNCIYGQCAQTCGSSVCGNNSKCNMVNGYPACLCDPGFTLTDYGCLSGGSLKT